MRRSEILLEPLDRQEEALKRAHHLVPLVRGHPGSDGTDQLVPPRQEVLEDRRIDRNRRGDR